ncbi:class I adenylate-forming enzyme family protein [Haliangium sp.]|uniref:class I adenylate-forming enzyme family protein n=1 Tax=Haliangium sp. TaxID=2663208 RepID=UPI003D109BF5
MNPRSVIGWLQRWRRERPDDLALVDLDGLGGLGGLSEPSGAQWSYARLGEEVDRRAGWLIGEGVQAGHVVAVHTGHALEQRLLRWACHRIGATEAVLDPRLSAQVVPAVMDLLSPALAVRDPLPAWPRDPDAVAMDRGDEPGVEASAGTARILFTTGSTGTPRAVVQSRAALERVASVNVEVRGLRRSDRYLAALPAFHAAGSLFEDSMIRVGGAVVVPARGRPDWLRVAMASGAANLTSVVPSMLHGLMAGPAAEDALRPLRLLNYAGEPMPEGLLGRLLAGFSGALFRGYGATEAGPLISVLDDAGHRDRMPSPGNVGRPVPGVSVRTAEAGEGEPGELLVRSPWLMNGYLGDLEATRARLADGWLRTGDLGGIGDDGCIHLSGRVGTRIRSGGEWIDPGAVERSLLTVPGIDEAVVVGAPHPRWGERPVAYVRASGPVTSALLEHHLGRDLAGFEWPDRVDIVDALPYTSTGKVDRRSLSQGDVSASVRSRITLRR